MDYMDENKELIFLMIYSLVAINVCSAMGAFISTEADENGRLRINVDPERCVAC